MTPAFCDPLLWLRRFRHRCGYGVHSPFAFSLLENVVYESLPYYAFAQLDARLAWWQRFRVRRYLHLLFRLSNYQHPDRMILCGADALERASLTAACPGAKVIEGSCGQVVPMPGERAESTGESGKKRMECLGDSGKKQLIFLAEPDENVLAGLGPDTLLLLANVHRYRDWWDGLPKVIGFDLYDLGIAFFDPRYNRQDYIVSF